MTIQTLFVFRALILATLWVLAAATTAFGQTEPVTGQPFAPHWFPKDLLTWNPKTDGDSEYNRSRVPLAVRFRDGKTQANPHARPSEARVASLAAFGPTSKNPSQGEPIFDTYTATFWQYTDVLVYWGGSSGEGLILAPKPTVTDAAHRNGVPVLGTLFFPPVVYGGRIEWLRDLVQKRGDTFPIADKLIEAANYYGFDGWFFNAETDGADAALVATVQKFLRYLQKHSHLRIMWYDAMNREGTVGWQGALNERNGMFFEDQGRVSNNMFLDFRWRPERLVASRAKALRLSRSPYDLYAGIDVEGAGYNRPVRWESLFPENQPHTVSLGFYRPEWTFNSSKSATEFYGKESRFWVGAKGDPGNTNSADSWKGMAHYIPEQSPITTLPFVTNFSTGQGHRFVVDGAVLGTTDWNNLSLQDVLPTWRWRIDSDSEKLLPELDWSDSYNGGTSLKVSGSLSAPNTLKLFSTRLKIDTKTIIRIVAKTPLPAKTYLQVGLAFAEDPAKTEYLDFGATRTADWTRTEFPLKKYAGRTVSVISLRFAPDAPIRDYAIHIGQMAVLDSAKTAAPKAPANPHIEQAWFQNGGASLRLKWTPSPGSIYAYNVYRRKADGTLAYLGSTPDNVYFVHRIDREQTEGETALVVEAVNDARLRSKPAVVRFRWSKP